ncbi:hypothetical protein ACIQ9E_05730 [Streptomyces sp. NPDC094448]|uniref:hypothetical protein n=1 Tax=Streptomyces sp. NPDC094448 TaxID=3366063 RepID=UPI003828A56A
MISEPELVGGDHPERGPVLPGPPGIPDPAPDERPDGGDDGRGERLESGRVEHRLPLRPWQWGAAGAVAASLLWAGGLFAYQATTGGDPDPGPYRAVEDLCAPAVMKELTAVLGKVSSRDPERFAHPAMDEAQCSLTLGPNPAVGSELSSVDPATGAERKLSIAVRISYTLHRKTDPGPEFDARILVRAKGMHIEAEPVPEVGERAYRMTEGQNEVLHVLDGQAVLELQVYSYWTGEQDAPPPSLQGVEESRGALEADARALLESLRGGRA